MIIFPTHSPSVCHKRLFPQSAPAFKESSRFPVTGRWEKGEKKNPSAFSLASFFFLFVSVLKRRCSCDRPVAAGGGLDAVDPAALHSAGTSANVFTASGSGQRRPGWWGGGGSVFEYGICSSGSGENPLVVAAAAANPGTSSLG